MRDTLGLTYDVSFELSLFDRLPSGAHCTARAAVLVVAQWGAALQRDAQLGPALVMPSLQCPLSTCLPPAAPSFPGWWHVNVTSTPGKIQDAMMASLNVLRNVRLQPITQVGGWSRSNRGLDWAGLRPVLLSAGWAEWPEQNHASGCSPGCS